MSDHTNFTDMKQSLFGKTIVDKMAYEFDKFFSFKYAFARLQNYSYRDHVELRMLSKEMPTMELPSPYQWKTIEKFGRTKYTLHGSRHGRSWRIKC